LGVALDAHSGNEQYTLESNDNLKKGITDTDFQVGIPKLVSSEKKIRPLYEISHYDRRTLSFGIDYELINYGNDLYSSFLDVVNNRNSLIQALEYQSGTINENNDLYFFSLVPVFPIILNITDTFFLAFGFGYPIFTSVGFDNEKYESDGADLTSYFSTGLNSIFNDNNFSLFLKFYSQEVNAEQENPKKSVSIKYENYFLTFRYYL
jgi:hypothetical protein